MTYLKTEFFDKFKCIADRCSHTCCGGWTIIVDNDTALNYVYYGVDIVVQEEKNRCILPLDETGKCKLLDEKGLCQLVKCYGDEMLSYTCKVFPRSAAILGDVKELYLSNGCPAVLEFIYKLKKSMSFVMDDNTQEEILCYNVVESYEKDRNQVIDLLQISELPLWMRFFLVYRYVWHIEYDDVTKLDSIRNNYNSVEYILRLCEGIANVDLRKGASYEAKKYVFKLIFNTFYKKEDDKYVAAVKQYLEENDNDEYEQEYLEYEKFISEYDLFFENIATNMFFSNGCKNITNDKFFFKTCLGMIFEHSIIRFHLFVQWFTNEKKLTWKEIRDVVCFYARKIEHNMKGVHELVKELVDKKYIDDGTILLLLR